MSLAEVKPSQAEFSATFTGTGGFIVARQGVMSDWQRRTQMVLNDFYEFITVESLCGFPFGNAAVSVVTTACVFEMNQILKCHIKTVYRKDLGSQAIP